MPGTPSARDHRSVARVYQLISELVAPIVLGLLVDWQFATSPWGLLIGTLVGLLMGGWGVSRLIRQLDREAQNSER